MIPELGHFALILVFCLAFWIVLASLTHLAPRVNRISIKVWGMHLAHLGVAICVLGIVLSKAYSIQKEVKMSPGDEINISKYAVQLVGVEEIDGPNYLAIQAHVMVTKNGRLVKVLLPQQRIYNAQRMMLAKTDIEVGLTHDLYVALGQDLGENAWAMRIYFKPFVRWIWLGGLIIVLGGLLAVVASAQSSPLPLRERSSVARERGNKKDFYNTSTNGKGRANEMNLGEGDK